MHAVTQTATPLTIQEGYRMVALEPDSTAAALQLCLVLKTSPDPIGGPLVSLGETADASIFLGCVTDVAGQVHEWVEVWMQNLENLETRFPAQAPNFCNALLDQQWAQRAERWYATTPESFIVTGREK